jgi:hypothetical protein
MISFAKPKEHTAGATLFHLRGFGWVVDEVGLEEIVQGFAGEEA